MRAPTTTGDLHDHVRRSRRARRATVALAVLGLLAGLAVGPVATPAGADATPGFQLPFPCGETWWGATYSGHSRYWAIDFNTFNGDAWERGRPVLASAAGTVVASAYDGASGRGHYVELDHGGGWLTRYLHLDSRAVSVGQQVARGALLGGVGGTPSYAVHLHYEQRLWGVTQPAVFGGVPFTYTEFDLPNGYQGLPVTSGNCGTPVSDPCGSFWDVSEGSAFCGSILWAADRGITTGYRDGSFRPTSALSRQAMAAFLWRFQGEPAGPQPAFTDVGPGHPFADAIGWLASTGLSTGYEDGSFRPEAPLSRQAMAAFLWRLAGSPTSGVPPASFTDVGAGHPFELAIAWLAATGISTGYDDGSFRPDVPLSRQAMVAFLERYATTFGG